ncbi:MAG: methylated-DNA--[protein]-cysteine S-methyltransferase [Gammaproteobacteria bacterium]|nr:methylated-DNA--[protein]-cysteine S-methyltransferase [Gammaproteobacteria bacterium]
MHYAYHDSPIGPLLLAGRNGSLTAIRFPLEGKRPAPEPGWQLADASFGDVREQLDGYFAGRRQRFDLPLAPSGTAFQRKVLAALQAIPYGETRSYKEVAAAIGKPRAVRAVGAANGRNPIPIIIPCHRVIGSDGSLTGFGGGLAAKRALLALEGNARPAS